MASSFIFLVLLLPWQVNAHGGHGHGDADGQDAGLRSKGLIAVKIYCLVILLLTTFAGGVSPYFYRWNESFLLLGTQFAGGIFLGTSMMHFLSDATETLGDLTDKSYPFSFMLASVGYALTMAGDVVISAVTRRSGRGGRVEAGSVDDEKEAIGMLIRVW
ncbi:uncharacterized protein A4U43_C07F1520 [Asparagus officinalis]|uniref:Zinc transporter n=1 Tax=Asparagus officinalis TaxID=4686 RepID=A0A5P1EBV6_ASPOF|nr:uncharacterized protein A4U43_C07F1520 [Asparagus officinalis]